MKTIHILLGTIFLTAINAFGFGGTNSMQNGVVAPGERAANYSINVNYSNPANAVPGKCTLSKAPDVSGFTIGQTIESLESTHPGFKAAYDKEHETGIEGNKKANFMLLTSGDLPRGNALEKMYQNLSFIWHFLDGKLMAIVQKDVDAEVKDEKKFVADTAKKFGLPTKGWVFDREGSADLTCGSFSAMITTGGQPGVGIMITDTAALKLKESRQK